MQYIVCIPNVLSNLHIYTVIYWQSSPCCILQYTDIMWSCDQRGYLYYFIDILMFMNIFMYLVFSSALATFPHTNHTYYGSLLPDSTTLYTCVPMTHPRGRLSEMAKHKCKRRCVHGATSLSSTWLMVSVHHCLTLSYFHHDECWLKHKGEPRRCLQPFVSSW